MKYKLFCTIFLTILLGFGVCGQYKIPEKDYVGKTFYLKNSLIFMGYPQTPRISPSNISFISKNVPDNVRLRSVFDSDIIRREEKVSIESIRTQNNIAILTLRFEKKSLEVFLSNKSKSDFTKSFDLAFSKEDFTAPNCEFKIKSKRQLIKCFGFPIRVEKSKGAKNYIYTPEFSDNACGGFDICSIKISKDGLDISGSM